MATLATGTGMGRLIGLASIPLLTRIYAPNDYGTLSIYTALVAVLAPVLTLRYVLAIPLPRRDATAIGIVLLSCVSMGVLSLIIGALLWAAGPWIFEQLSMSALVPWWWLVLIGAIATATYEMLTMWATRRRAYRVIAKTLVLQSLFGETMKIGLGLLGLKPTGLLIGQAVSQSGGVTALALQLWRDIKLNSSRLNRTLVMQVARSYCTYPALRLPSQFVLVLAMQAPLFLTARYFDAATTGQLGLALMALGLPVTLLGDSMGRAYYAEISAIGRRQTDQLRRLTYSVIKRLLALSIAPTLVLAFGGRWLFPLAFGQEWQPAGVIASILSIYLVFQFIQKPVSYLMFLYDGQKLLLYLNIQRLAIILACFYAGHVFDLSIHTTLIIYSLSVSLHYLVSIALAVRCIGEYSRKKP